MAHLIPQDSDEDISEVVLPENSSARLAKLQQLTTVEGVNGHIEPLYSPDGVETLICHGEALLYQDAGFVLNVRATLMASLWFGCSYPIFGPVVLAQNVEGEEGLDWV